MFLDEIMIYPLKSGKGRSLAEAVIHPWGLDGDRRWAVVDEQGDNLWLGEFPRLASVDAYPTREGGLRLAARGMERLTVPPATGPTTPVGFTGLDRAVLADDSAHVWFTELLGRPARLVWLDDPRRRSIDPAHGGLPGEVVSFAWDAPLLLVSESSARVLDGWLAEEAAMRGEDTSVPDGDTSAGGRDTSGRGGDTSTGGRDTSAGGGDTSGRGQDMSVGGEGTSVRGRVFPESGEDTSGRGRDVSVRGEGPSMRGEGPSVRDAEVPVRLSRVRFRPNVIVEGAEAFAEDGWREVRIGMLPFRVSELCDRCAVTTIDPETQVKGKEPMRTLARRRKWDGKAWFGIRLVPLEPGRIQVGDPVSAR
ncbi:MOSC domain-containing protein, partial [Nonomuraea sp. RK-328]|nr:MOSC domain-containing protein [Nonomuraea sp. RK-328]